MSRFTVDRLGTHAFYIFYDNGRHILKQVPFMCRFCQHLECLIKPITMSEMYVFF